MPVRHLTAQDYTAMPWRNGKGVTVELAREDDAAGAMLWRVSQADVVEDGAFSPFPGIDRILTLTHGPGFDLDFDGHGRVAPLEMLVPVAFSGDWNTRAENVRGPSRDLNVMTARGRVAAAVTILDGAAAFDVAERVLLLALAGGWTADRGGERHRIGEGDLLILSGAGRVELDGTGVLARIDLRAYHR